MTTSILFLIQETDPKFQGWISQVPKTRNKNYLHIIPTGISVILATSSTSVSQQFTANLWHLLKHRSVCLEETDSNACLGYRNRAHKGHTPKSDTAPFRAQHAVCSIVLVWHFSCGLNQALFEFLCAQEAAADCLFVLGTRLTVPMVCVGMCVCVMLASSL